MFGAEPANTGVVFHHAGQLEIFSDGRNLDDGDSGGNDVASEFFPVTDKRKDTVTFPAKRDSGVVDHVGNDVPVMFSGVASGAVIEPVMSGSDSEQDGSFPVPCAHFAIILA